jgi:hypothetical protein
VHALTIVEVYESFREVVAAGPQLQSAYVYLLETGLGGFFEEKCDDKAAEELVTECNLLLGYFRPISGPHKIGQVDVLLARFERFRWSYVEEYRSANRRWLAETEPIAEFLAETQRLVDALRRLDFLPWLETTTREQLFTRLQFLSKGLVFCNRREVPSLGSSPRCANCGYVIGSSLPLREVRQLLSHATSAYKLRMTEFAGRVTKRIGQLKGEVNRLDSVLKLIQFGEPDALRFSDRTLERFIYSDEAAIQPDDLRRLGR